MKKQDVVLRVVYIEEWTILQHQMQEKQQILYRNVNSRGVELGCNDGGRHQRKEKSIINKYIYISGVKDKRKDLADNGRISKRQQQQQQQQHTVVFFHSCFIYLRLVAVSGQVEFHSWNLNKSVQGFSLCLPLSIARHIYPFTLLPAYIHSRHQCKN